MIRILFFIPDLSGGGAEKVLCNLVNNMDQSQFDITVQTVNAYDPKRYLKDGIHYKAINRCKTELGKALMNLWYRFCTEFQWTYPLYIKDDYDIEVAFLECGATKVLAGSTNKRAKKIAWVHCDLVKKGLSGKKIAKQYVRYDKVVCVSKDVQKSFDAEFKDCSESIVLYNVIDENEILAKAYDSVEWNSPPEAKKLLAVGRLCEQKNFGFLIETCKKLKENDYPFTLKILGEGPEREVLQAKIESLGLGEHIQLKGYVDNPYPWIRTADYIVCSSLYEGISTIAQEALLLGKIVVTTPCTGMPELLGDSEYGVIAEDSPDGLYNGISMLMDNPDLELKYIQAARMQQNNFGISYALTKIQQFFTECLSKK